MSQTVTPTIRKVVELNTEDTNWFQEAYEGAHLSWVLTMLLKEFRKSHALAPADYAAIAAKSLYGQIEDGAT